MKKSQLLILLIILFTLSLGIFLKKEFATEVIPDIPAIPLNYQLNPDQITRIQISKGKESNFFISKESGVWKVPELSYAKADQERVERLMKTIPNLKGDMRANHPDQYKDFAIDNEQAIRVRFYDVDNKVALDFFVGFMRAGFRDVFVRTISSTDVYLVKQNLLGELGIFGNLEDKRPKPDFWASLSVFDFSLDQSKSIKREVLEKRKIRSQLHIIKEGETNWKYASRDVDFVLDSRRVQEYFFSLEKIRASKIVYLNDKEIDFNAPDQRLEFVLETGETVEFKFYSEPRKSAHYIKSSISPLIMEITNHHFSKITRSDTDFRETPKSATKP